MLQVGLRASMATGRADLLKLNALERIATARKSLAAPAAGGSRRSRGRAGRRTSRLTVIKTAAAAKEAAADVLTEAAGTVANMGRGAGAVSIELFGLVNKLRDG